MEEKHQTAADFWGEKFFSESFDRREWQSHPLALERLKKIHDGMDLCSWLARKYLKGKTVKRAVGIGVGDGTTEIGLLEIGAVEHFDLYDVSPVGLDYAKACAEKKGFGHKVTCHCMPIDDAILTDNTYDLVSFVASLHHMYPLEPMLQKINRSLKDDGVLWGIKEYIGPDRFDYPEQDIAIVRAFFRTLPDKLRNPWLTELQLPTAAEVAAADPTESPCSSQIVAVMNRVYPRVELTPLYGSFAFIIFWCLNHDALYSSPEGVELVRFILGMDKALVQAGILPNYFAHLVAHKQ